MKIVLGFQYTAQLARTPPGSPEQGFHFRQSEPFGYLKATDSWSEETERDMLFCCD
jgi:hypothetical protein